MLPMPETSVWSRRRRLISVSLPRIRRAADRASKAGSNGSAAMCAAGAGRTVPLPSRASARGTTVHPPKVRWSTNRSSLPSSRAARACRCRTAGARESVTSICPLIPRCTRRQSDPGVSSPSSVSHRYFPRRRAPLTTRPVSSATISSGPPGWRRAVRAPVTSTSTSRRPTTCVSRPRRTTSTSGSSGTSAARAVQCRPGLLGRLLLGLLRGAPGPAAELRLADESPCGEGLVVIGARSGDLVVGAGPAGLGALLLEAGLPVQRGPQGGDDAQSIADDALHDLARDLASVRAVDGPEDRLHGVRAARVRVATARGLLALTAPRVCCGPPGPEVAGDVGEDVGVGQARADLGQVALRPVRVGVVEVLGHHELEYRVTEELEPLVVGHAPVLVRVGPVRQRLRGQLDAQLHPEQFGDPHGGAGHASSPPSVIRPNFSARPAQRGSIRPSVLPETPSGSGVSGLMHSSRP